MILSESIMDLLDLDFTQRTHKTGVLVLIIFSSSGKGSTNLVPQSETIPHNCDRPTIT